ncbi:MAG TPA: transposase [Ktedonobacterales bacterium]|nr:transposase [Ktedonobacterales bacterium]
MRTHQAAKRDLAPPTVRKTVKDKLRPTAEQDGTLACIVRRCRDLYTAALQERRGREAWRLRRVSSTGASQRAHLPDITQERPEYPDSHSPVLQEVLARLDRAFRACCRRVQHGEQPGYPRGTRGNRSASFTYKQCGTGAPRDTGSLVRATIGCRALRGSRPLDGPPQPVTLRREADGWYAPCSGEQVPLKPLPVTGQATGQATGLALGLASFATRANGQPVAHPRVFGGWALPITPAQRRVGRRHTGSTGSKRRRTAVKRRAKAQQTGRRARQDVHHKEARPLVQAYDALSHASLPAATLLQNHHLAKALADLGWRNVLRTLTCTAAEAGQQVVAGTPACTAPACSGGGAVVRTGLSVRWQACPDGGTRLQRDQNAALNLLKRGPALRAAGQAPQVSTQPVGADVA